MSQDESVQQQKLLMQGRFLSEDEAREVQQKADADPKDIDARLQLIAYYHGASFASADARQAHEKLVLWFIENHPESGAGRGPAAHIDAILNPAGYAKAKKLWLTKVEQHGDSPVILANAASFFLLSERSKSEELLLRAQKLEPDNENWARELGQLYKLSMQSVQGEKRREVASQALEQFERCLELETEPQYKNFLLSGLSDVAFEAGADAKAEQYATRLLATSQERQNWNTGNAVHHANLVLGRLALKSGNIEKAKAHLIAAGKTSGSPQLNSFGPNMTLARDLLKQGEKTVVLEYFELCRKFWKNAKLDQWSEEVAHDKTPNFGANLFY